jgi:hypothetical protein
MPNHAPVSRYLLLGIAALMLGAALPDMEVLLAKVRPWRGHGVSRVIVVDWK